ncbi:MULTISPECIES: hypothetical protein [Bacillus cereus group]|uniref:Uncharacterized protein n=1 Tax=Bacillus thuringiensis serovar mexicanensis TaxID=180868 RepID=A0A242WAC1_BACTU|nr:MULTISPECIES: hypothetical protein [Bacillus cereus group]EEM56479.1 hypothetical protein bthur0007_56630 [Bacillus thuringiensis serovar monterrey BGSC 4AJ1]MEB9673219.1 hypothetical protein [Bacillus anthracis]OTW50800.1 hypothetical protein BK699_09630 [Bacillus thuringiensis serovar mexicanensis]OTX09485.1 hypothetical protein BK705_04675 [Bacillus thuringiensis serovar monterrey]
MKPQVVPLNFEYPYFRKRDGSISIWDDPSIEGGIALIDNYQPLTNLGSVLGKANSYNYMEQEDVTLLKMVGECIAANENQLKRLMSTVMSRSQVSLRLKKFRRYGFVERWDLNSLEDPDLKPPSPFTLGLAGYIFLKHFYNKEFFMEPTRWQTLGLSAIQRYVAINEIKCQIYETQGLRGFKWQGCILNNPQLINSFAAIEALTEVGNLNFVLERVQQSKDYIAYLSERLMKWDQVYQQYNLLPIQGMSQHKTSLIISVSCFSLAEEIITKLNLELYKLPCIFCIEEKVESDSFTKSFYVKKPDASKNKAELLQVDMPFFK